MPRKTCRKETKYFGLVKSDQNVLEKHTRYFGLVKAGLVARERGGQWKFMRHKNLKQEWLLAF